VNVRLDGKVAMVPGGSRGIGRAIAAALAEEGAKVAVVGRDLARAEQAAAEIGHGAKGFACDVASQAQVDAAVAAIEKDLGSVDVLVNNAGLAKDNVFLRLSDDDWDAVLDANLKGAFHTIKAATRGMMKRRWGRIINVSSVVGLIGNKGQANYAASKAGLLGLTKSIAKELASRNVTVNAVAPGFIATEMVKAMPQKVLDGMVGHTPLGRMGEPRDIAETYAWLASPRAAFVHGTVISVDGGLVLGT